jgi:glycyl-tRNA synthetase beta chain
MSQFLLEVLCEEIPANALPGMRQQLEEGFRAALVAAGLGEPQVTALSTVRRVAVHAAALPVRQPDRVETVTGPPVRAAYGADGAPTQAAVGFARGQGVAVGDLREVDGPKGRVVAATRKLVGRATVDILAEVTPEVFRKLHFPKTMRWGNGEHTFVRPVHNVVALFGADALDEVVRLELFGVRAGSGTVGHRVIAPGPVELRGVTGIDEYGARLATTGVVVEQRDRAGQLAARAGELAAEVGCRVRPDSVLVAEHVELVEFPGVVRGRVADRFLELPEEVLVTTLRHHQKCLVLEKDGQVAPYFLTVSDRADDPNGNVVTGNEWVAGARLADAEFFFRQDREKTLEEHDAGLERVMFHQKLGSYAEKRDAVVQLFKRLTDRLEDRAVPPNADGAARLAKADLVTAIVGEFPELQGVVGGIYARLDGEPEEVWRAIYDQYTPSGLDGDVPKGPVGTILGVADRLDTLAGLFAAGEVPSGSKDPFALRRAALAVVKICAESRLGLRLDEAVGYALTTPARAGVGSDGEAKRLLLDFLRERERYYLTAVVGVAGEVADAVLEARWGVVPDDVARARALEQVRQEPVFADLAVAFKRVRNILAKAETGSGDAALLREPAEAALVATLAETEAAVEMGLHDRDYAASLRALSALAAPLDRFFTDVMVLCDDAALRGARLALLRQLESLFLRLADLSRLATTTT